FQPFPNPHCIEFALPKGKYELILHNNAPFELPNLRFAGLEKRHTLAVYAAANKDDTSQYKKVMEPDVFGLAEISELQVTEKMIEYFPYKPASPEKHEIMEFSLAAHPSICEIEIIVHVTGLHNAAGAPVSSLSNLTEGILLFDRISTGKPISQEFILNNRQFDSGSSQNGRITKKLKSFGFTSDISLRQELQMNFKLVNGDSYPVTSDVTEKIEKIDSMKYRIRIDCVLPDVPAVGGGDSGFNPDVEDWENAEADIPMQ
ncbi:MAG: DUF5119 domain-containing protein, partial [Bacteroidales bacterium]